MYKLLCTYLNKIFSCFANTSLYIFMFLKTGVFQMGMFHELGYFGAHVQKPKEDDITWDLKHMTRTMEQPGSMAPKTYTYNGGHVMRNNFPLTLKYNLYTEFCTMCKNLHLFMRLSHFVIPISWHFFNSSFSHVLYDG
jgi:hypothetical protein